ncbi:hypothetical protein L7F22_014233 [Adiantum nelumboides]|nr:hypothetical protein [Adiantum nelumboides]
MLLAREQDPKSPINLVNVLHTSVVGQTCKYPHVALYKAGYVWQYIVYVTAATTPRSQRPLQITEDGEVEEPEVSNDTGKRGLEEAVVEPAAKKPRLVIKELEPPVQLGPIDKGKAIIIDESPKEPPTQQPNEDSSSDDDDDLSKIANREEVDKLFLFFVTRPTKLLDDEIEADEEFWGQDAFKEVAEDAEYEAEEDVVDEFDSDFDEDEANAEEEAPVEEVERVKKKRLLPPGSRPLKSDQRKTSTPKAKGLEVIEAAVAEAVQSKDEDAIPVQHPKPDQDSADIIDHYIDLEGEKTVRKSTRTAVVIRQAEREALRAAMQATAIKPVKKKREGERRITQEDMLLEAAQTGRR